MAHLREVFVIVLQFDGVLGEGHDLVLHLERPIIHPYRDGGLRQAPLPVELPILETQKSMLVEVAGVAGSKQDTVEELCWINRAFVPREDLDGAVAAVLTLFVRPMALYTVIAHPFGGDGEHSFPRSGPW